MFMFHNFEVKFLVLNYEDSDCLSVRFPGLLNSACYGLVFSRYLLIILRFKRHFQNSGFLNYQNVQVNNGQCFKTYFNYYISSIVTV